ncbi:helix-turn-helix domain-containing protein [Listeria monocytogenes]|nr:helix-turn-helix transcriptional regulator [Listeria monocytogenes]EHV0691761.1 helix-turn-helix transcriptional regulator [Listeria monocytogenes]
MLEHILDQEKLSDSEIAKNMKSDERSFSEMFSVPSEQKKKIEVIIQITKLRKQHNLSQAELAERCGVTQNQIARIENLDSNPTLNTLLKVLGAFDKTLVIA